MQLGITGHRKLVDPKKIRCSLQKALFLFKTERHIENVTIYSPLAKGADRIAVNVVFELFGADCQLVVPVPFALEEYKKDFDTPNDLAEFEHYFNDKRQIAFLEPDEAFSDLSTRKHRYQAYLAVGQKVVDHCHLLIAIWNGEPAPNIGSTGDIVEYALSHQKPVLWVHSVTGEVQMIENSTTSKSTSAELHTTRHQ